MYGIVVVLLVGVGLCAWGGVGAGVCVHRCKVRFCHAVVSHMVTALSPPFLPSFSFKKSEWWWVGGMGLGWGWGWGMGVGGGVWVWVWWFHAR